MDNIKFWDLIHKLDDDQKNIELILEISKTLEGPIYYEFKKLCIKNKFENHFIQNFIDPFNDEEYPAYSVRELLAVYARYLKTGISFIPFTHTNKDIKSIKKWCKKLSIKYNKVKVNRYVEEYCLTHKLIVPEDDPCPEYTYDSDAECDIEFDYTFEQTKLILHDDNHSGTFEELKFKWDDTYVNGGYII